MAKYKNESKECAYQINPLGTGLPLCTYNAIKEKKLDTINLKDFPMCNKSRCFKVQNKNK